MQLSPCHVLSLNMSKSVFVGVYEYFRCIIINIYPLGVNEWQGVFFGKEHGGERGSAYRYCFRAAPEVL